MRNPPPNTARKQINCRGQSCAVGNDAHSSAERETVKKRMCITVIGVIS
jgi:hypothetical protein